MCAQTTCVCRPPFAPVPGSSALSTWVPRTWSASRSTSSACGCWGRRSGPSTAALPRSKVSVGALASGGGRRYSPCDCARLCFFLWVLLAERHAIYGQVSLIPMPMHLPSHLIPLPPHWPEHAVHAADATSEAIRDWVTNVESTHYILGSVAGPHPYPMMVCGRGVGGRGRVCVSFGVKVRVRVVYEVHEGHLIKGACADYRARTATCLHTPHPPCPPPTGA
jgi:hypothetical protein